MVRSQDPGQRALHRARGAQGAGRGPDVREGQGEGQKKCGGTTGHMGPQQEAAPQGPAV